MIDRRRPAIALGDAASLWTHWGTKTAVERYALSYVACQHGGLRSMARSEEYRRLAAEALALAHEFEDPARAALLQMAQAWLRLADQTAENEHWRSNHVT